MVLCWISFLLIHFLCTVKVGTNYYFVGGRYSLVSPFYFLDYYWVPIYRAVDYFGGFIWMALTTVLPQNKYPGLLFQYKTYAIMYYNSRPGSFISGHFKKNWAVLYFDFLYSNIICTVFNIAISLLTIYLDLVHYVFSLVLLIERVL